MARRRISRLRMLSKRVSEMRGMPWKAGIVFGVRVNVQLMQVVRPLW